MEGKFWYGECMGLTSRAMVKLKTNKITSWKFQQNSYVTRRLILYQF